MKVQILASCLLLIFVACNQAGNSAGDDINELSQYDALKTSIPLPIEVEQDRYAWQKPDLVMDKLGDLSGKVIADIGAGTGYFTFRLMQDAEKVIAIDIDPDMINLIDLFRLNLDSLQQSKVEPRLATPNDSRLSEEEVDVVVIINTIGYIRNKTEYLSNLYQKVRPNGELMIVDFKMKRIPNNIAPAVEYRVSLLEMENLLTQLGYDVIEADDRSLDYQYIVRAKKI